jgi:hypothetical protein
MYYEINVSKRNEFRADKDYSHFFATAPRSITTMDELKKVIDVFVEAFPSPEYNITITKWEETGQGVSIDKVLNH